MTLEGLRRVMWRLRHNKPGTNTFTNKELKRAIIMECGCAPATYDYNRAALKTLGWIKKHKQMKILVTNKDLTDS
jgi:hypothetical protein